MSEQNTGHDFEQIAIIGMAGRFPGADSVDELWDNLENKRCSIRHFTKSEYRDLGYSKKEYEAENFVPALGYLKDYDCFDETFFSYSPNEVRTIDPQQRIFLETAWQALFDSGVNAKNKKDLIGVFAGSGFSYFLVNQLMASNDSVLDEINFYSVVGSDKDFLTTRVAYKLNLEGPSYTVQSACSTSMLAVHQGVQNLLTFQCDIALCGGVSLQQPKIPGYLYEQGEIFSPDGKVKVFDKGANGTVFGEGCGVVVLKRLSEAIADRDNIYAIIKSSAVNNDGSAKAGYSAPSIAGQQNVIRMAQNLANVNPEDISYIETHGTGTALGDLIEVSALKEVFRNTPNAKCAIGSIKSNIGHLDTASGIAGLIKCALSLKKGVILPQINIETINPELDLDNSPFYIPRDATEWIRNGGRVKIAGVSSFGVGGTNVHLILEEPPIRETNENQNTDLPFIPVSSHDRDLAFKMAETVKDYFEGERPAIADMACTAFGDHMVGKFRSGFTICRDGVQLLHNNSSRISEKSTYEHIVFMYPGQGSQYAGMGASLYETNKTYKENIDVIAQIVQQIGGYDIRDVIFRAGSYNGRGLNATSLTQICLFSIEFALTRVLDGLGIQPTHLIGHSLGEITAAAVSGVFDLDTAIRFILARGEAMENGPAGNMVAVFLSRYQALKYCGDAVFLAVVNGPSQCVLSCDKAAFDELIKALQADSVRHVVLKNTVPFHTNLLKPHISLLEETLRSIDFGSLDIPFLSNATGDWADTDSLSPSYWIKHVVSPVQFDNNLQQIASLPNAVFIEVGPGRVLSGLLSAAGNSDSTIVQLLLSVQEELNFARGLGTIWTKGVEFNVATHLPPTANKIHLPKYQFIKNSYPVEIYTANGSLPAISTSAQKSIPEVASAQIKTDRDEDKSVDVLGIIADAWKVVLGYDDVDANVDFFSIGGDSISAVKISARLAAVLGTTLPPHIVMSHPTIERLNAAVESLLDDRNRESAFAFQKAPDEDIPITYAQKRLWFLHEYETEKPMYNLAHSIRINKAIDLEVFEEAVRLILLRHDIFSMSIINRTGDPYLHKEHHEPTKLELVDLVNFKSPDVELEKIIIAECKSVYDFERVPLYRVVLYKITPTDFQFVLYIHHVFSDGWSFDVFHNELEICYDAIANNHPINLSDLPYAYRDHAYRENRVEKKDNSESINYWQKELSNCDLLLQLPTDFPRPDSLQYTGNIKYFSFNVQESKTIRALSSRFSVSLFSSLVGIYSILLHKCTSQDNIVIGIPDANRNSKEIQGIFGLFLNMLPLKLSFENDAVVSDVFSGAHSAYLRGIDFSGVNLQDIVDALKIPRRENVSPIFQTIFAFQNYMKRPSDIELGVQVIPNRGVSEYDLSLYMWERDGEIQGAFEYSDELFKESTIEMLIDSFKHIAHVCFSEPQKNIADISIASEKYQAEYLSELNNTAVPFDPEICFIDHFKDIVKAKHSSIAAQFFSQKITYNELDVLSDTYCLSLNKHGVKPKDIVGIYLNRGIEMLVSILAVFKAGAAYVPLDPHFPDDRLRLILNDSKPNVLISSSDISDVFASDGYSIINIENINQNGSAEKNFHHHCTLPDDRTYILYTSGSTGVPNGVQIPQRALMNFLHSMSKQPGLSHEDKMLALTTFSFDISVLELLLPLFVGASIEIIPYETATDADHLAKVLADTGITVAQGTPATWQMLVDNNWTGLSGLKILCGGERLSKDLTVNLLERDIDLWNMYGPTETTIWSSIFHVTTAESDPLIGHPIDNTLFYILDEKRNLVPSGIPGELYIGGTGLSLGYLNRPELNAARFVDNPFGDGSGSLMYKTGDRVVYAGDGNIKYLERIDHQVKIRGFRIELGEIENIVDAHAFVKQSVCTIKTFANTDRRLVLYVRTKYGFDELDLKKYLKTLLPDYMIPTYIVEVDSFPKTPNGKIDRKNLPEIDFGNTANMQNIVRPKNKTQEQIVDVWKSILGIEDFGITDNFFEIGGHSLLAVRLINEMNNKLKMLFSLQDLFRNPTVEQLSLCSKNLKKRELPLFFHVNKTHQGQPVFIIPGVYNEMYYKSDNESAYEEDFLRYFNSLLVNIKASIPIYGLRPRGIYRGEKFKTTASEMAKEYIREIKKIQPVGPYIIAGECLGGLIALEVAWQLEKNNDEIRNLILMDTHKMTRINKLLQSVYNIRHYLLNQVTSIKHIFRANSKVAELRYQIFKFTCLFFPVTQALREQRRLLLGSFFYAQKLKNGKLRKIEQKTVLIINEDWNGKTPNLGWTSKDFSNLDIRIVPGDHTTKLTVYGETIRQVLYKYLNKNQQN